MKKLKRKNWKLHLALFVIAMLMLMVNDAVNNPEDFMEGFNFFNNTK